jgi:hypothetical protein
VNDSTAANDHFGSALVACNFDDTTVVDLAIGVWGEDVGTATFGGGVEVIYGSGSGLDPNGSPADQFFTQDSAGMAGDGAEAGDHFGFAVGAGDFNGDLRSDLAVGVPLENTGGATNAGAVNVIYGAGAGLDTAGSQFWTQSTPNVDDVSQAGDKFGFAVAGGDFDDTGIASLAIGVPGEDMNGVTAAGIVNVLPGSSPGGLTGVEDETFHQAQGGMPGTAENGDRFGEVLATGDYGGLRSETGYGPADLAVGVPHENLGSIANAGTVVVIYGSQGLSFSAPDRLSQEGRRAKGVPQKGDRLGAALD